MINTAAAYKKPVFPLIKLAKNKAPIVKFIIDKATSPTNVGFFLPYFDNTQADEHVAMN